MPSRTLILLLTALASQTLSGQTGTVQPFHLTLGHDSGLVRNPADGPGVVWSTVIPLPQASSFQLRLADVVLGGPGDAVLVKSRLDGQTHRLDTAGLRRWNQTSAWLNGDVAEVSLELAAGSTGRVRVDSAAAFPVAPGTDDLCGIDDRVPSSDSATFRIVLSGFGTGGWCTGFLYGPDAVFLSAGRPFNTGISSAVAQFNVPASTFLGNLVMPPVHHQFPVDPALLQFSDGGPGHDWAVGRLLPNGPGSSSIPSFSFAPPAIVPIVSTARMNGHGEDQSPDLTRNGTQQTSTGSLTYVGMAVYHDIDSQAGSEGSPVFFVSNSFTRIPIAINTHGGCQSTSTNIATSLSHPGLQSAIASVAGCIGHYLLEAGESVGVTCSPTTISALTTSGRWNVMAVTSASNWDLGGQGALSALPNGLCDFVIANGTAGPIAPFIGGQMTRVSGTDPARVQSAAAESSPGSTTWTATSVVKLYQISAFTTDVTLEVTVTGDPSLRWILYRPDPTIGSAWRERVNNGIAGFGIVGSGTVSVPVTVSGWHALVIYRDGGVAPPAVSPLLVRICPGGGAVVPLSAGVPAVVTPPCAQVSFAPVTQAWNVVGAATLGQPFGVSVGPATSLGSGMTTEFVLANGHAGALGSPTPGLVSGYYNSPPLTVEHAAAQVVTGGPASSILPAGHVFAAFAFNVSLTGPQDVLVTGDASLNWYLFDSGMDSSWRGRSTAIASGQVGEAGVYGLPLSFGVHAVVIVRNAGLSTVDHAFTVRLGPSSSRVILGGPGTSAGGLTNPGYQFTTAPAGGQWNAVGIFGTLNNGWSLSIGSASQGTGTNSTALALANGHLGFVGPLDGLLVHYGFQAGTLHQSGITTAAIGIPATTSWDATKLIHLFEFEVPAFANYDILVTGSGGLGWSLFAPGGSSAWIPRSAALTGAGVGSAQNAVALQPGWHAIAVARGFGIAGGTSITCSVTASQNPLPVIMAVTPNAALAGGVSTAVTVDGAGFAAAAEVTWDGTTPLPVTSRSATQIVVQVPASLIVRPGAHEIRVVNPAPGGGVSAPAAFTALPPHITAISPDQIPPLLPGSPALPLAIDGADFLPTATVTINGAAVPATFVNPGRLTVLLEASIPGIASPGALPVTVANGHLAQSNTVALQIKPGAANAGTIVRAPLQPLPGEAYEAVLEGGPPGQPFAFVADLTVPSPQIVLPGTANLLLGVGTPGATVPILDGIGLAGPPNPFFTFVNDPNGLAPASGIFRFAGLTWPTAPINLTFSLQTVYLDPARPLGIGLSWVFIEDV